ncbi:Alcohol dehydrogenase [Pseudoalteromonas luteoviolacea B = ATCC 29581]|nr:Alcohol dehydrogenase [Pseudoalteromonas luteoviolacea B = ATCC 29581]
MQWFYRIYHFILKCIVIVIGLPNPKLHQGKAGLETAINALQLTNGTSVLLVTDRVLIQLGIPNLVIEALKNVKLNVVIFDDVEPNPTLDNVEKGLACYHLNQCQAIISVGGGSVMDCAKFIGARVVKPNKSLSELKGLFKVLKHLPPNIAIPTTAGTGSETTVAAVINDPKNKLKYAATDFALVPHHAVLLSELTVSLPSHITATTAIDALTHAIEALLSINALRYSDEHALQACQLIFDNLPLALNSPSNLDARANLLLASHLAGRAFTRTSVGYVHALSHQLSARYGTPHGLANAVLLLPVLNWYGEAIYPVLAKIALYCKLTQPTRTQTEQAKALIQHIETMLINAHIPKQLSGINSLEIEDLAKSALNEAHPDYPVPIFMNLTDCQNLFISITTRA